MEEIDSSTTWWRIDARDRIVATDDAFKRFAVENGTPDLAADLVGQSLWEHLAGIEVRHLYELLLESLRAGGRAVTYDYRCDSPTLRRYLQLTAQARPNGDVDFRSTTLEIEPRDVQPLLDAHRSAAPGLIRMCSWCKRLATPSRWIEVERAVAELGLFEADPLPGITHAVCPDCERRFMDAIGGSSR
ncbi:MAG: hypothetical protein BIFFINMI_03090 [Phycisphaerae bacterium]|nr:hypothetical protein [Phycisphaerae bacterium]